MTFADSWWLPSRTPRAGSPTKHRRHIHSRLPRQEGLLIRILVLRESFWEAAARVLEVPDGEMPATGPDRAHTSHLNDFQAQSGADE